MQKIRVLLTACVAVLVVVGYFFYHQNQLPPPIVLDTQGQPTEGKEGAKVHVVTFQDFKCSGCKHFTEEIYPELKMRYINTGKVRYTIIPIAFLSGSKEVAHAALCVFTVQPKAFFNYVARLFDAFSWEDPKWSSSENLMRYAEQMGNIDLFSFRYCIRSTNHDGQLKKNYAYAKEILGKKIATPTVFVDGIECPDYSFSSLSKLIERRLKEVERGSS